MPPAETSLLVFSVFLAVETKDKGFEHILMFFSQCALMFNGEKTQIEDL